MDTDHFLPPSLVKLVMKIAKVFEFDSFDEFSLLDNVEFVILRNSQKLGNINEKTACVLIVNIIRLSEKFNNSSSKTKLKAASLSSALSITKDEYNSQEFSTFSMMGFKFAHPSAVEIIHNLVELHLPELHPKKEFVAEFSLDILRLAYIKRREIYDVFTGDFSAQIARSVRGDVALLASAVMLVVIKIFNVSDRIHNRVFDAFSSDLKEAGSAARLNRLAAIIFDVVRMKKVDL